MNYECLLFSLFGVTKLYIYIYILRVKYGLAIFSYFVTYILILFEYVFYIIYYVSKKNCDSHNPLPATTQNPKIFQTKHFIFFCTGMLNKIRW